MKMKCQFNLPICICCPGTYFQVGVIVKIDIPKERFQREFTYLFIGLYTTDAIEIETSHEQVAFQSNANHPLAESMGYIEFEGM